jgi:dinuclear metal center YbgI/SA1388 family protein
MKIDEIIQVLEQAANPSLQESYDNSGLLTGNRETVCTGVMCSLDVTEAVIEESVKTNCNLIVAHHPLIFGGIKKITGSNYVERTIIAAIKNNIAIYAIHTNLDNIITGVNQKIAEKLGLINCKVLLPKAGMLKKLFTFVPVAAADAVRDALFKSGAGQIGNYSACSFNVEGTGTYTGNENTNPFAGKPGMPHRENELKIEVVFPSWLETKLVKTLLQVHPYEEVAYDIIALSNEYALAGSGLTGELSEGIDEAGFISILKKAFGTPVIRHSAFRNKPVRTVALCGGAGSFLISNALKAAADVFVTADLKYHEFFGAEERMLLADIGHFESEQFTINLLEELIRQKFPTFAVRKTSVNTNPVHYS